MTATLTPSPFNLRLWLAVLALWAVATVARADDTQAERDRKARAALALTAGKSAIASAPAPHAVKPKDYPAGYKAATAGQRPLVVFVGCEVQPVADAVACKCDSPSFGDVTGPAVVVGYPVGDRLMIDRTIQGCPTPATVQKAVKDAARKIDAPPSKAMPAPKPLDWSISADAPADRNADKPYDIALPAGAQKYDGTKYTQSISVLMTAGGDRDVIKPVPVLSMPDTRWRQAGGMEGITGYTSERYKFIPEGKQVKVWVGNVEVENSITNPLTGTKYRQNNRAILRSYPDGTRFDEVLTNSDTGVVFEHRVRTKKDGKWLSEVWHKDEAHFPKGYTGLKVSCTSCHGEAGTGKYDAGLVPGGDTVLSDPLPWEVAGVKSPEETEEIGLFGRRRTAPPKELPKVAPKHAPCPCGDGCKCKEGECPLKCPTAKPATATPAAAPQCRFLGYDRFGRAVYQLDGGCAGGGCGLPMRALPQSCPNGRCQLPGR